MADYLRKRLNLEGPAVAVSCACASSAKAFGSARRMIEVGLIDAALVGGVDSLCLTTLYGFHSLQLSSPLPCRPYDVARDGISIGEAAAFGSDRASGGQLLNSDDVLLLGVGESSDAYHMSAPHPEGRGARRAMQAALAAANLDADAIDYINLHGTGTPSNDRSESRGRCRRLWFDHSRQLDQGGHWSHPRGRGRARGGYQRGRVAGPVSCRAGVHTTHIDPSLAVHYLQENRRSRISHVLSNSFGFGGTNCSLIFGRAGLKLSAYVGGIGALGPGLADWTEVAAVLTGRSPYRVAQTVLQTPALLPAAERRRTGRAVKLALAVALEATTHADTDPRQLASVFSSSGRGRRQLSRTLQGTRSRKSRTLADEIFQFGTQRCRGLLEYRHQLQTRVERFVCVRCQLLRRLLEALTQVSVERESVLLVAYDTEYPQPIHAKRPIPDAFGVALVLTPDRQPASFALVEAGLDGSPAHTLSDPMLEAMRLSIPAARSLRCYGWLALQTVGHSVLDYLDVSNVNVRVEPCI